MSKDKRKSNKKFKQLKTNDALRLELQKKFKHLKPTSWRRVRSLFSWLTRWWRLYY